MIRKDQGASVREHACPPAVFLGGEKLSGGSPAACRRRPDLDCRALQRSFSSGVRGTRHPTTRPPTRSALYGTCLQPFHMQIPDFALPDQDAGWMRDRRCWRREQLAVLRNHPQRDAVASSDGRPRRSVGASVSARCHAEPSEAVTQLTSHRRRAANMDSRLLRNPPLSGNRPAKFRQTTLLPFVHPRCSQSQRSLSYERSRPSCEGLWHR